jgi:hypothetical protein
LIQSKSGRSSAPFLPEAEQTKRGSDVGEPDLIGPAVAAHRDGVAAVVIGALDQQPTHAVLVLAEVIFCGLARVATADIFAAIGWECGKPEQVGTMGEHPATILQPNVTKLGGIRTSEARRAGTPKAERPNKQGLLGIRTNRGGWLQANYKTAALPLS